MIKKIENTQKEIVVKFLKNTAPKQVQFITETYFEHGENISFGWYEKNILVGCIRYCIQEIGYEQNTPQIIHNGQILMEAKIHAFAVKASFRNRGIGKKLQQSVIENAKQQGCHQVSSYSTFDKKENYAVKVGLGFCVQPETQPDGTKGCFFLMKL